MSPSLFGWIAIAAIVLCLYVPSEGRRSASRDAAVSDGHGRTGSGPQDCDGPISDDSGSDDSGKGDSDD
jgi:hypothetical protein